MKRVEYAEKEPATGKMTANSPRAWTVQYSMKPIIEKAMRSEAGPPVDRALPDPTKSPVPFFFGSQRSGSRKGLYWLDASHQLIPRSLSFVDVFPSISAQEASLPCAAQLLRHRTLCRQHPERLAW